MILTYTLKTSLCFNGELVFIQRGIQHLHLEGPSAEGISNKNPRINDPNLQ